MAARNIWRESRFELMEDKFVALPMFLNCLPFCTDRDAVRDLFRYKTMTTEQAAVVLPVFGEWKGDRDLSCSADFPQRPAHESVSSRQ